MELRGRRKKEKEKRDARDGPMEPRIKRFSSAGKGAERVGLFTVAA